MENMQFTYNFVDGVNNPVNQASVPATNTEAQIRSVNIYLGARSNSLRSSRATRRFTPETT